MSAVAAQQALIERVATMPGRPAVVLPNDPDSPAVPRYVIQVSATGQRTATIRGITEVTAEIVVRVETADGAFANESDALVAALVARFPVGARFDGVTVLDAPNPRPPLTGEGIYSVPVLIRGRATF